MSMVIMHVWYVMCWHIELTEHSEERAGEIYVRPLFLVFLGVCLNSSFWWRGMLVWHLWIGRARHPGPGAASFAVEVFNVGGWLTHGDLVLDTELDFLAVVEHRLIPAWVRGGWARLRSKGLAIVWALASQDTSHVGHAGVGVVSLRGAPLSLRSSSVFLIVVVRLGVCCLWGVVGFCTGWCCKGIRVLIVRLRSLL